jgi:hypothetical protein
MVFFSLLWGRFLFFNFGLFACRGSFT